MLCALAIDLIPDFIPVLGYLDDVILLPTLIALTIKLIPKDVWMECREKAEGMRAVGKPHNSGFIILGTGTFSFRYSTGFCG